MTLAMKDPRDNPLIPISDTEISQKLPGLKIVSYPELANGLPFDADGRFMLLYVTDVSKDSQMGHWVCVYKRAMRYTTLIRTATNPTNL